MRDFTVADQRAHVVVIETETGKAVRTEEVKDGSTPPPKGSGSNEASATATPRTSSTSPPSYAQATP